MRFDMRLAKSKMENEEGMNHLWIRLLREDEGNAGRAEIQIRLPDGIYRAPNLNGYAENEQRHILVEAFDQEVIVEVYTRDAIQCGERTIEASVLTAKTKVSRDIKLQVVEEDEMDLAELDEEVVARVKALRNAAPPSDEGTEIVSIHPRRLEKRHNEFSYLAKKYRIDY